MLNNLRTADLAAIGVIESYSDLREPLYRIIDWPDLSHFQRGICLAAMVEGHRSREGHPLVSRIAAVMGVEDRQVVEVMKAKGLPYSLGYIGRDEAQRLMPTEALTYGVES